ncbi:MAG: nascent polypeptide-associated complex protein [Candidatus Pacearchaeota archaeon]
MIPGMGGGDPKQMKAMMKKMGISQEEIDASKVIIEKSDGGRVNIDNPSVTKIKMQGQESFQISGDISEESAEVGVSEDDVKSVMDQTGCSEEEAKKAIEETGDLAEAVMKLSG